jgi:hypothetical protein
LLRLVLVLVLVVVLDSPEISNPSQQRRPVIRFTVSTLAPDPFEDDDEDEDEDDGKRANLRPALCVVVQDPWRWRSPLAAREPAC